MWSIFKKKGNADVAQQENAAAKAVPQTDEAKALPKLQVLGSIGCVSCKMQLAQMQLALKELGYSEALVEYVEDIEVALSYGVMSVPAVVIDGKVVGSGKVLKKSQIIDLLKEGKFFA